jgi:CHASE3 domain sensor protein
MKKIMAIFLVIIIVLSLTSCTKVNDNSSTTNDSTDTNSGATIDISSGASQQK